MNGWIGRHYGCKGNFGWEPPPYDACYDDRGMGRAPWYPAYNQGYCGPNAHQPGCALAVGGGPCCAGCASGVGCEGRVGKAPQIEVGRSRPTDEIATFDSQVNQLKKDMTDHESANSSLRQQANWTALALQVGAFKLRWGQWMTAQRDDYWWGDDDELVFSQFKDEYNRFRDQIIKLTAVNVTAPVVDVPPPAPDPDSDPVQQITGTVKGLVWFGAIAAALVYLGPPLLSKTLPMLRKS